MVLASMQVSDYHYLPETAEISETLRSCLQESEELPKDFTTLFDMNLFKFDTSLIPAAVELYDTLQLKKEPLTLIQPQVRLDRGGVAGCVLLRVWWTSYSLLGSV